MLRNNLVPKLQHGLVLGAAQRGTLRRLDAQVRHVRLWLRLPKDTPVAYFHAQSADGQTGPAPVYGTLRAVRHFSVQE